MRDELFRASMRDGLWFRASEVRDMSNDVKDAPLVARTVLDLPHELIERIWFCGEFAVPSKNIHLDEFIAISEGNTGKFKSPSTVQAVSNRLSEACKALNSLLSTPCVEGEIHVANIEYPVLDAKCKPYSKELHLDLLRHVTSDPANDTEKFPNFSGTLTCDSLETLPEFLLENVLPLKPPTNLAFKFGVDDLWSSKDGIRRARWIAHVLRVKRCGHMLKFKDIAIDRRSLYEEGSSYKACVAFHFRPVISLIRFPRDFFRPERPPFSPEPSIELAKGMLVNVSMKKLRISIGFFDLANFKAIAAAVAVSSLAELALNRIFEPNDETKGTPMGPPFYKAIADAVAASVSLVKLDLRYNQIGTEGATELAAGVAASGSLAVLNIAYNNIGDLGIKAIADAVAASGSLAELDISANDIGDEGAKAIAKAVAASGSLTTLSLWGNKIGDEGAKALAAGVAASGSLATLELYGNNIGDEGAKALAEAVAASGSLTSLDVQLNKIGDLGAKSIADAVAASGSLAELDLRVNQIGDAGAKALAAAVAASGSLALKRLKVDEELLNHAELKAACESKGVKVV